MSQTERARQALARHLGARVARMSLAKRAGPPRERHLEDQSCEDVSSETRRTTSSAASRSPELRGCLRRNGLDRVARGISEPRVARMPLAKRARQALARHLGAQKGEDVSGETARITSRTASRNPELRGCIRRNVHDHLSRGTSELRVARMSQVKRPGKPRARHLRAQNCEDVSGGTCQTSSRAASRSPELRGFLMRNAPDHLARGISGGCLRRNLPDHLARGLSERQVVRMSQAKRARLALARHLGAQSCEDVSGETARITSRTASRRPELRRCLRRNGLEQLSRGISEPRVGRMSQAKRLGSPREQHLGAQSCEDVSGEMGWNSSRTASRSSEFRGCLRRSGPD